MVRRVPTVAAGPGLPTGPTPAAHGRSAPDACSIQFDTAGASAFGTAAQAGFWLAVEQNGPWGRQAATQSHLPAEVGAALDAGCSERGGRLSLIRRPGRHPDTHHGTGRTAYAGFSGEQPWLLTASRLRPEDLLALDLDALAAGDRAGVQASLSGARESEPVLLVCTNGRRDVCCAVRGRPVAVAAAARHPGQVWEASHTGGHRFAPTGVLLPFGATLARLDAGLCAEVLDAAQGCRLPSAALGPAHDRGLSARPPANQAAESYVRHLTGETSLAALSAELLDAVGGGATRYAVHHVDGRSWLLAVELSEADGALPESCGTAAAPLRSWQVTELRGP